MNDSAVSVIMAVENVDLRAALLSAIAPLACFPDTIQPNDLMEIELSGYNLIFLETSNDTERLVSTARQLWSKWGETGLAAVQFLSYSTHKVTTDDVVFRLWDIGPEMIVIVQMRPLTNWTRLQEEAHAFTQRIIGVSHNHHRTG